MSATQATVTNTQVAVKYWRNVSSLSIDLLAENWATTLSRQLDQQLSQYVERDIGRGVHKIHMIQLRFIQALN